MEMFNAPNHPAWGRPNAGWGTQNATPAVSFGRIRSTSQLRQIQFALKYYFRELRISAACSRARLGN